MPMPMVPVPAWIDVWPGRFFWCIDADRMDGWVNGRTNEPTTFGVTIDLWWANPSPRFVVSPFGRPDSASAPRPAPPSTRTGCLVLWSRWCRCSGVDVDVGCRCYACVALDWVVQRAWNMACGRARTLRKRVCGACMGAWRLGVLCGIDGSMMVMMTTTTTNAWTTMVMTTTTNNAPDGWMHGGTYAPPYPHSTSSACM
jgi:hypothetical protein